MDFLLMQLPRRANTFSCSLRNVVGALLLASVVSQATVTSIGDREKRTGKVYGMLHLLCLPASQRSISWSEMENELVIEKSDEMQSGQFKATVKDQRGRVLYRCNTTTNTETPPAVMETPRRVDFSQPRNTLTIQCRVMTDYRGVVYKRIRVSGKEVKEKGQSFPPIVLQDSTSAGSVKYGCEVMKIKTKLQRKTRIRLRKNVTPRVEVEKTVYLISNQTAQVQCTLVAGHERTFIRWTRRGSSKTIEQPFSNCNRNQSDPRVKQCRFPENVRKYFLFFTPFQESDAGKYSCEPCHHDRRGCLTEQETEIIAVTSGPPPSVQSCHSQIIAQLDSTDGRQYSNMIGNWLRIRCCLATSDEIDVTVSWYYNTSRRSVGEEANNRGVSGVRLPFQRPLLSWRRSVNRWSELFISADNLTIYQGVYVCHARSKRYTEPVVLRRVRVVA